jgi:hypothetical protein
MMRRDSRFGAEAGNLAMTTFDKREKAFEAEFVHDEELKFKAEARRNKMLGLWAAEKLGLSGDAAADYSRAVVTAEIDAASEEAVVRKIMSDLAAKDISLTETDLRARMNELLAAAVAQIKAGV